ncbi:hypothetical protein C2S53_011532 [Perilla frutescens var. hirtella]|uniref:Receptor-like serine/threonine-protein kinase n=1 Tax=Perilla frutescens var. hirtella TaxID=608512 RepID=A0AAD4JA14_PERFH|nr:hypothetical protein C2S53_011532 [Perilla frutescens var. hirtella]
MNTKMAEISVYQFIFVFIICFPFPCSSLETDTITSGIVMKDPDSIISQKKVFKFGFFSPAGTTNRYVGVFYAAVSEATVAWIANRHHPLPDSASRGAVTISSDGNLILIDGSNRTIWSTNATVAPSTNTTLRLHDTGNLALLNAVTGEILWESFSLPSNVLLPTMKISHNVRTGEKVVLTSWKTVTDADVGSFSFGIEASRNIPQQFVWRTGSPIWRSGPWNGLIYLGIQDMFRFYVSGFSVLKNDSEGKFEYFIPEQKVLMRSSLNASGNAARTIWDDEKKSWRKVWSAPEKVCDFYGKCGVFGSCDDEREPVCSCMRGFEPTKKDEWEKGDWRSGCSRRNELQCGGDGFMRLQFMKVPDFAEPLAATSVDECRSRCLGNCSCLAYAFDSNIGCLLWDDALIDSQRFNGVGVDLFVRLSASELDEHKGRRLYIIIPVVVASACISIFICIACRKVKRKGDKTKEKNIFEAGQIFPSDSTAIVLNDESNRVNIGELPQFTFEMVATATDQFHDSNLLGRGGFGHVYKGRLPNGKEIAVKRLSTDSGQGMQEFMNEVTVMSKLQHRNLVKLLGGCVEREEKILIYEYMPNKSLDASLFDPTHSSHKLLDWMKRFTIIEGVARGLLYLHRDSRLRIIHRDLKPSNILLDGDWNPKISDFGMARIFGGNQDHKDTARVVGTFRYMAPEYALEGRFSEKSDVYSFGVLMLEIVKGERNTHYYNQEWCLSLLGCAWKLWSEDNGLAFADESIASPYFREDIVRCIHIGLLCVQDSPMDRPVVETVVSMLSREAVDLPAPKQPLLAEKWNVSTETGNRLGYSMNELTLSVLEGR